jgi:PadR family transcriptional regulator, regulatory protein AphA
MGSMSTSRMPERLTSTSYALLGLLGVRSWTTYELAKQVQRSLGWFWPRAERKLYDEPKRLVAAGYATAADERTGRRPRTVYAITPAGRRELRRWLGEPSAPAALEFEAMVRVFFADSGTLEQLRATLEQVAGDAEARQTALRAMIVTQPPPGADDEFAARRHVNALALRFQLDHERQQANWARWALEQVATWTSAADPGDWDWRGALDPS